MTQFFIGIAAPRSGTTWLWRQFKRCENVVTGKPKELGWFLPNNKHSLTDDHDYLYRLGFKQGKPQPGMLHHEFTPGYVECTPEAFKHMDALLPGVKLVAVLRHPVERALSHARFIGRQLDGDVEWSDALGERVLRRGRYSAMFENLHKAGMLDRLHVTTTERLFDCPNHEFKAMCAFLGVRRARINAEEPVNRTTPDTPPEALRRALREHLSEEIAVWEKINEGSTP